jgi:elongation factor P
MAILAYNEIKERKIILHDGEPCEVVESHVARTQQRKPQNQVKLKSLISGKTFSATFHVSDQADEADITKREVKFLYHNRGEYWFCDPVNPKDRFMIDEKIIGDPARFLKENTMVSALVFTNEDDEEQIIGVKLPIKMEFTIKDTPPSIKGSTVTGGNKIATLENNATVTVPMFLSSGDKIIVNTETGEYVERA